MFNRLQNPSLMTAIIMTFIGFSMWSFSDSVIRLLKEYPATHVAFIAGIGSFSSIILLSHWLGGFRDTFYLPKLGLRFFRGVVLMVSNFMAFITFAHMEMAPAYAIIFIIPVAAKILSVLLTKETISARSWVISLIGFLGVLIVVRPGMVPFGIGAMAALALVFFFAVGQVMTRWIGKENQTLMSMSIFQYSLVTILLGIWIFARGETITMDATDIMFGLSIGVLSVFGAILVSNAYACHPAAYIAPVQYSQILWGIALGALLFGEYPDVWTLVGAGVIITSGLLLLRSSKRRKNPVVKPL